MATLPPLTRRQRQILDFFAKYTTENGISPTLEEVAQEFGLNKVTIFGHVAELERKGVLVRAAPGISRGLRIVDPDDVAPSTDDQIPIIGRIAAGSPVATIEDPETFSIRDWIPSGADVYALRVQGNSMIEDGIHDGDLVMVEKCSSAPDGATVVAVLPGEEATLKRLFRTKSGFRLEPANASMEPIYTPHLEIRGVVLGVMRRYGRRS
ncbi:transcriptional repressor LexA [Engelhardtia mirabilis]|uniref:LexA repressor n=1 Tax=Engelhardtia mirabilis TaxID=2528011 RepID=A0A518BPH3_9BACT|nr:LexA repressor [Planctomycetes bacterium Pla133]QDV03206.1 LexA repressor [Planctomycetes bacterium Pla86]